MKKSKLYGEKQLKLREKQEFFSKICEKVSKKIEKYEKFKNFDNNFFLC